MVHTWITAFFIMLSINVIAQTPMHNFQSEVNLKSAAQWRTCQILTPTQKKPARTAILIIAPPIIRYSDVEIRWQLGKKVWELYMNSHPNVDCYFIQSSCFKKDSKETAWIEGNTIYVGDSWYENSRNDRILNKTIKAIELLLPNYTHFFRTNINTFFNLKNLHNYTENHHQSMFTTPIWEDCWYAVGYSILFTKDVASHLCHEYNRLEKAGEELISCYHSDDGAITALATGIWPYDNRNTFRCCSSLPFGVKQLMCKNSYNSKRLTRYGVLLTPIHTLEEAYSYCNQASQDVIIYRTRDGLNLMQIAKFYDYIFQKTYPELPKFNFVEYLNTLKNH